MHHHPEVRSVCLGMAIEPVVEGTDQTFPEGNEGKNHKRDFLPTHAEDPHELK
jgi:hypothetical protein